MVAKDQEERWRSCGIIVKHESRYRGAGDRKTTLSRDRSEEHMPRDDAACWRKD